MPLPSSFKLVCHAQPADWLRLLWVILFVIGFVSDATPQSTSSPLDQRKNKLKQQSVEVDSDNPASPQFESPTKTNWDFGMKITASGYASGITASVPIPLDWPEQTITSETEFKPPQVGKIKYSQPTKESRLMTFQIPQMAAGETLEVFIRFEITKRTIVAPRETSVLRKPETPPSLVKPFLKPSPFIESNHRRILEISAILNDDSLTDWEQVEVIYRWVRDNLEYKFDAQIRSCLDALDSGHGDCEELSSLFIAICRAMKIPARAVLIPDHTYPEFYLVDENGKGYWFPCQVAGEYQFGSMSELRPVINKGDRFRIPGQSSLTRYLQPTLIEKSGQGQIQIEWITLNRDSPSKPE